MKIRLDLTKIIIQSNKNYMNELIFFCYQIQFNHKWIGLNWTNQVWTFKFILNFQKNKFLNSKIEHLNTTNLNINLYNQS